MALQFILGNSGSGKSHYLYNRIIEAAVQSPEKNFLVIVPEQFTMQTQRELVRLHPDHGLFNIDILSFQRLAHRIFGEVGADTRTVLEDTGKTLLLRRVASKKQDELKILKSNLKKQGYLQEIKSLVSELTQYDIDEEKMEQLLDCAKERPALYYKLEDIRLLFAAFQEELEGKYITAEETLEALCQVAGRSKILKDSVIALDGFTGFTPIQQKLMHELLTLAAEVYVTVTIDSKEDFTRIRGEHELFYLSKKTIRMLYGLAQETKCELRAPVVMEWKTLPRFAKSTQLAFLESHMFRSGRAVYETPETEKEEISFHIADTPIEEAYFAARTVRKLLKEGYRYQEIAVLVGDPASYANYLPRIFAEYEIPCFMDNTRSVLSNPLIEFVRASLDLVQNDYSSTSVFRLLRTGLCGMEREEADLLENYVIACGVRGFSKWQKTFERQPKSFTPEQVEQCEHLREQLMDHLAPFTRAVKGKNTVLEKTVACYELLSGWSIQQKMAVLEADFERRRETELQKEYARIYQIVMDLFDKLVELLSEEQLSLTEYAEILEAGFSEAKVGLIPPTIDSVQVGDLERSRLKDIRALIFLGLNEGWVPSAAKTGGLLSDLERESLEKSGVELAPTARANSYIQKFYVYLNLTKPQERLYLSCSRSTASGETLQPSYLLGTIRRLFPSFAYHEEPEGSLAEQVQSIPDSLRTLAEGFSAVRQELPDTEWMELYRWCSGQETTRKETEKLLAAAFTTADGSRIGREAAKRLYGETLAGSVSRLERFAGCAFSHFLQYGLRLQEREEYSFHPNDMGQIFHDVMEHFAQKVQNSTYGWKNLPDDVRDRMIDECVEEAVGKDGQQILHDTARNEAVIVRMKRILRRTAWAVHQQVAAGSFVPVNFEVPFSQGEELNAVNISLPEHGKMKLRGRIDRIDTCEKDDQVYVKVVDYKSGNTSFDMTALYYGLQLQLVVYLNAALEMEQRIHPGKKVVPAGILYSHMKDPLLEASGKEPEGEIRKKQMMELRPDGLINADPEVFGAMDPAIEKTSRVIPVTVNKDGTVGKSSHVATEAQFSKLSGFVHRKMQEIGGRIMSGEIEPVPYQRKQKNQSACAYCIYREVCRFDEKVPGTRVNYVREFHDKDVWEKM